jgi:hypothetical protein
MEQQLYINKLLLKFQILLSELKSNCDQNIFRNYCNYATNSHNYYKNKFNDANKQSNHLNNFHNILYGSMDINCIYNMIADYNDENIELFINSLLL